MAVAAVGVIGVDKRRSRARVRNRRLVYMRVMADVADAVACFVRAVTRRRTQGELEWQKQHKKDNQKATHGGSVSGPQYPVFLGTFANVEPRGRLQGAF